MPTGVALRDVREQLFDAAERVLLRDGASGLTSRAVTTEAGCAKGVLHRHFEDFDGFLVELVLDRLGRLGGQADALRAAAGTGNVVDNLTEAVAAVFGPLALAMVHLVIARDELRTRLRARTGGSPGIPLLNEAVVMVADYLRAELRLGRLVAGADVDTLARTLIGAAHLWFAGQDAPPADHDAVRRMAGTVVAPAVREPR